VPSEAQAYLADWLEGRLDRRGRPRKAEKRWSGNALVFLLMEMDALFERYKASDPEAIEPIDELAYKYNLNPDTLDVYLKQARKLMEIPDAALALDVNEKRQRLQLKGAADPLTSALELVAAERGLPLGHTRGSYDRGKRYIRKHVEDSPEFK
jgi:hypothetical protein